MNLLYRTYIGSHLYGTNIKGSDDDFLEVNLEPLEKLFGVRSETKIAQHINETEDKRIFYFRDYMTLNYKGNPNTFESLWASPGHIQYVNPIFKKLFLDDNTEFGFKRLLINRNIIRPHLGFAKSQIHKLKNRQYIGSGRKSLIDLHGFDVKYASHAIRLLYQLEHLITENTLVFPYQDNIRQLIVQIKTGQMSYDDFIKLFNEKYAEVELLANKFKIEPNPELINDVMIEFYKEMDY